MDSDELLFGRIACHNGLISQEQLDECTAERDAGDPRTLGEIILEKGYITDKQFRAIEKNRLAFIEKRRATAVAVAEPPGTRGSIRHMAAPPEPERRIESPVFQSGDGQKLLGLLAKSREIGASDLHISCGAVPFCRKNGLIQFFNITPWSPDQMKREILAILSEDDRQRFLQRMDLDTCLELTEAGRFRTNVLMQRKGVSAVFRVIKTKVPTLEDLGLPETLQRFTTYNQGIVLVTGAAGSGKSSTLAALIEIINRTRKENIITLEDPIEYVFECKKCNIIQRQVERHTESWGKALRASLRQNPDVIMVGEMRDLETISLAITAAETGHLVLATLHTSNATRTVDRILDVFPPKEQAQIRAMVSESLRGVISQTLIPRKDGKGRVAALEVLFSTPAVGNLIRERRTFQLFSVLQTGKKLGMRLMDDSLADLVERDLITVDEARSRAVNKKRFP